MAVIRKFMDDYKEKLNHYEKLAQICAHQCESGLKRQGLRALVTYRAKRLDSLTQKVEFRSQEKTYKTMDEIYEDIVDLAGVRIALYFPGDKAEVDSFMRAHFIIDQVKNFPEALKRRTEYEQRFSGYAATHYRLRLKADSLPPVDRHLAEQVIEVQVGSVLMHAWAEVEHDLVYKSTTGPLSQDEYAILDELNGLMHAGEIALERLQWAVKRRIHTELQPFSNHYELSSYLYDYATAKGEAKGEPFIGRTDVLFHFLKTLKLNSVPSLRPILAACDRNNTRQPLAKQIVDQILKDDPSLYDTFDEARLSVGRVDPFGAPHESLSYLSDGRNLGQFMRQWISAEQVIEKLLDTLLRGETLPWPMEFDGKTIEKIKQIRDLRDDILHGDRWPSENELADAREFLHAFVDRIRQKNGEQALPS